MVVDIVDKVDKIVGNQIFLGKILLKCLKT